MKRQIKQLKEFHKAFNLPMRETSEIISPKEFTGRHNLLIEEVNELAEGYKNANILEVADAITDCIYVLLGTALQFGIADIIPACFDEVHKSNMSKLDVKGKPILRNDGKVMKGELYFKPDLQKIISNHATMKDLEAADEAKDDLEKNE